MKLGLTTFCSLSGAGVPRAAALMRCGAPVSRGMLHRQICLHMCLQSTMQRRQQCRPSFVGLASGNWASEHVLSADVDIDLPQFHIIPLDRLRIASFGNCVAHLQWVSSFTAFETVLPILQLTTPKQLAIMASFTLSDIEANFAKDASLLGEMSPYLVSVNLLRCIAHPTSRLE